MTHFLLTNDDGIDAVGLTRLTSIVESILDDGDTITVIAPDRGRSECGHAVTQNRKLTLTRRDERRYCVDGTPVDCVRIGLLKICSDATVVISGINAGANLGVDLCVSGTFAAAREASLMGRDAIAISQYKHPAVENYEALAKHFTPGLIKEFLESIQKNKPQARENRRPPGENVDTPRFGALWNANLPARSDTPSATQPAANAADEPTWCVCEVDPLPANRSVEVSPRLASNSSQQDGSPRETTQCELQFSLDFHSRPRIDGRDVERCFAGIPTISKLSPMLSSPRPENPAHAPR